MPKLAFEDVGPAIITFDYGVSSGQLNIDLKPVHGEWNFVSEDQVVDIFEDEYGLAPVDRSMVGNIASFEVPLTRIEYSKLASVLPGVERTAGGAGGGGDILTFTSLVGYTMYDNAVPILLRPIVNNAPTTNRDKWVLIYKCHAHKVLTIPFGLATQRVLLIRFAVFPMQESGYEGKHYQWGVA